MKLHYRWNYVAVGVSAIGAMVGAVGNSIFLVIFNCIFCALNWHLGEYKRKLEQAVLLSAKGDCTKKCDECTDCIDE